MSLMGTLAKVAIGVMVAKTVGGMIKGGAGGGGLIPSGGGPVSGGGGPFGGPNSPGRSKGGLDDMMGEIFRKAPAGGQAAPHGQRRPSADPFGDDNGPVAQDEPASGGGGLGDLLNNLGRARQGAGGGSSGGGLDDVLGKLGQGGGLGEILGGLLGGAGAGAAAGAGTRGLKDVLNDAFQNGGEPATAPSRDQEAAAGLMLKAMIQAAKSDGRIDPTEQKKLTDNLGQATKEEMDFVRRELAAPVDVDGLCRQVPEGLGPQVYAMSLMAIDLDNRNEAQYLVSLARGLGLDRATVDDVHQQMGAPSLFA